MTKRIISPERLAQLNSGLLESKDLMEALAINFGQLLQQLNLNIDADLKILNSLGIVKRMQHTALLLHEQLGFQLFETLCQHSSDTVRGWAAYLLALQHDFTLEQKLKYIQILADDPHFGVREWAWLALRPAIIQEIETALPLLQTWVNHSSPRIRRFAIEITRPRGVWCAHLPLLKQDPAQALPLLEPLKAETLKYPQDSVANWLNDASKTQPDWVKKLCRRWLKESPTAATARICKRALRSLV